MKIKGDNMKKNKGFSLVELIIVIAIMAILVGVIAPVMMHFIEKSNVSSDYQLADTVRSCLSYSIVDAKVKEDPASQPKLNAMEAGPIDIATLDDGSVLKESVSEYLGVDPSTLTNQIRSKHGSGSQIMVSTVNGIVKVTITQTDSTGRKNYSAGNDIEVQ